MLAVLDAIEQAGVDAWVEGGWGIDALVGVRTRAHDDLDLAVDAGDGGFERVVNALAALGYRRGLDDLPVRSGRRARRRSTGRSAPDPVPARRLAVQSGHTREYVYPADGFTLGRIGDRPVACLTARLQRDFHARYEPRPVDLHDLARLDVLERRSVRGRRRLGDPGRGQDERGGGPGGTLPRRRARRGRRAPAADPRGGTWAHEEPWTEAHRQLGVRTRAAGALADVFHGAGFVPVVDDVYVSRTRLDLLVASTVVRPVRLVVLAPELGVVLARDATRADKTVGDRWAHLDAVQRDELAGVGLWIDSSTQTLAATVDAVWHGLDDAIVAP